jgi:hypothetical protein
MKRAEQQKSHQRRALLEWVGMMEINSQELLSPKKCLFVDGQPGRPGDDEIGMYWSAVSVITLQIHYQDVQICSSIG